MKYDRLKHNKTEFQYMHPDDQDFIRSLPSKYVVYLNDLNMSGGKKWLRKEGSMFCDTDTYRVHKDYEEE